jgi:hypothetical protein
MFRGFGSPTKLFLFSSASVLETFLVKCRGYTFKNAEGFSFYEDWQKKM